MLFNSLHFLLFFPIVVAAYFLLPFKYRWAFLLGASYYFYMCWKPEYVLLLLVSTLIDFYAGIQIGKAASLQKRKLFLLLSLSSNLGILFLFKYFNFLNASARALFDHFNIFYNVPMFELLLPVGISFYTFQTMSYVIDVYRGDQKPEKHFGMFALYVTFFPQLVAGPIERSTTLMPQFYERHSFDWPRTLDGLKLMLWGFFKKTVIADRAAMLVNQVYGNPSQYEGIHFIIATVFFAFQIYCDFSAYSDIAIGSASVMGIKLMNNFDRPYYSKSISEFWKRWHISLSSWLKDYLYVAIGGDTVVKWKLFFSLFVTFLFSGLWHGANWTYIAWGAINGIYIVSSYLARNINRKVARFTSIAQYPFLHKAWQAGFTFALVCFAWIFFRAKNMSDAIYIVTHLFTGLGEFIMNSYDVRYIKSTLKGMGLEQSEFLIAAGAIAIMEAVQMVQRNYRIRTLIAERPIWIRWPIYYATIFFIIKFGIFEQQEFIYFQF